MSISSLKANKAKPKLLFIYYARHEWPIRAVLAAQKAAWERLSGFDVVAFNVAYPWGGRQVARLHFHVVVYHSTALTLRWYPKGLKPLGLFADAFAQRQILRIAMPHDDYLFSAALTSFIKRANIDILFSVLPQELWPVVYSGLDPARTAIRPALTHYVDEDMIARANAEFTPLQNRRVWLCYRATAPQAWTGAWGRLKLLVGEVARTAACKRGRLADISLDAKDAVRGDAWYAFLARSRATVGVEGGSSVFDPNGDIFTAVEAFMDEHPDAPYSVVVERILGGADDTIRATALSPRHLEAAATKTAQVLVEGHYSDAFEPWLHYIPIKKDLSDMNEALDWLEDDAFVEAMVERAYLQVTSPSLSWETFFETLFSDQSFRIGHPIADQQGRFRSAKRLDALKTRLLPLELALGRLPKWLRRIVRTVFARDGRRSVSHPHK